MPVMEPFHSLTTPLIDLLAAVVREETANLVTLVVLVVELIIQPVVLVILADTLQ
jgi:hypothetical protein